jgi:hypothetical protein
MILKRNKPAVQKIKEWLWHKQLMRLFVLAAKINRKMKKLIEKLTP